MILHVHVYWDPCTLSSNFSLLLGPNRAQKNCRHISKILAYANAIQGFPCGCHLIINLSVTLYKPFHGVELILQNSLY